MKSQVKKASTTKVGSHSTASRGADRLRTKTSKTTKTHNGNPYAFTIAPSDKKGFADVIGQLVDNVFQIAMLSEHIQSGQSLEEGTLKQDMTMLHQLEAVVGGFLRAAEVESVLGLERGGSVCDDCGEVQSMCPLAWLDQAPLLSDTIH